MFITVPHINHDAPVVMRRDMLGKERCFELLPTTPISEPRATVCCEEARYDTTRGIIVGP